MANYKIRKRYAAKVAKVLALIMTLQALAPMQLMALTSGPTQPEFSEFEPVGTTQMVDLFSGDFVYNIPLFELPGPDGGYPFNLSYHSGITMDQEATWVGLGWTLNHGAITRTMRGLPDDFNGERVERKMHMKPNRTWRFGPRAHTEFLGFNPDEDIPGKLGASLGLKVSHNNYRGWGMSTSFGLSANFIRTKKEGTYTNNKRGILNLDLGLNVGSESGAGLSGGFSISDFQRKNSLGVSFSKSGSEGMQAASLGYTRNITVTRRLTSEKRGKSWKSHDNIGATGGLSYTRSAYSPQVTMPYKGTYLTGSFQAGVYPAVFMGIGGQFDVSLNTQVLEYNNRWKTDPAYGYFHLQNSTDKGLTDFNREKDGPIYKNTPNLATPVLTPDVYSVMGQGTGGMYRAYRSDIGIISDPEMTSFTAGGTLGFEINPATGFDAGADIGGNWAISKSTKWEGPSEYKFDSRKTISKEYEPFYFKVAGELTAEAANKYDFIGGDKTIGLRVPTSFAEEFQEMEWKRDGQNRALGFPEFNNFASLNSTNGTRDERKPRSHSIQYITNEQLLGPVGEGESAAGKESLNEYQIKYHTLNASNLIDFNNKEVFVRNTDKKEHLAGITNLQPNGMRYVYGLPVINKSQHEASFSVLPQSVGDCSGIDGGGITTNYTTQSNGNEISYQSGTNEQYLNHSKLPEYTHAHLLTSVLGADYVDFGEPGPSDEDYGYWVKFNYAKTEDYRWKTPFVGANLITGNLADGADDKGMIMAGEREQYYLATAETRTHIAEFHISRRLHDGRGAKAFFQNNSSNNLDAYSYQLNEIKLYSKLERSLDPNTHPIKTIIFNYAPQGEGLCQGIDNGGGDKLTLQEVSFNYENSNRGSLSPYRFSYQRTVEDGGLPVGYSHLDFDRWGCYKEMSNCDKLNFPYAEQDKTIADANASVWHLNRVDLPSGASINVEYESDDYAYVQDQVAMQMFKLSDVPNAIMNVFPGRNPSPEQLKLEFDLKKDQNGNFITDIEKYVDELHGVLRDGNGALNYANSQMYFKILTDLNNSGSNEFVKGYARIANVQLSQTSGKGEIELQPVNLNGDNYHPFAAAAWQYLKIAFPSATVEGVNLDGADETNFGEALRNFGKAFGQIRAVFSNFYRYCSVNEFASSIQASQSFIRLCTPDRFKMGGGCRVKQIVLQDNWDIGEDGLSTNDGSTYGQYFDYTTEEEDASGAITTISSGVAINEPGIGYDECALRYAKIWNSDALLATDEKLIYEYPVNESYYPGASVGYRKVTVKSLATHYAMEGPGENVSGNLDLPNGFGTTGVTVNEYYTAKDFPIITEEALINSSIGHPRNLMLGVFNASFDRYIGSQGYSITLNDMHGKPFKVTHYGLDQQNNIIQQPLSEVVYTYLEGEKEVETVEGLSKTVRTLSNEVPVLLNDKSSLAVNAEIANQVLGVDYEVIMDMRRSWSNSGDGEVGLNVDYTPPFIFGLSGIPRLTVNHNSTKTSVTNKIIRKSGILIKTDAYDGQSHITTSNEVFDPLTGEPLLTSVNNSFDDKIYNYNIPARMSYDRMGAAYENWGIQFSANLGVDNNCGYFTFTEIMGINSDDFVEGDEIIMTSFYDEGNMCIDFPGLCEHRKFTFVGKNTNNVCLFENKNLNDFTSGARLNLMIIRSGKRNHLSAKSGNIAALNNPLNNRVEQSFAEGIPRPGGLPLTVNYTTRKINKVLNASAVTYADSWDLEREVNEDTVTIITPGGEPIYEVQNCLSVIVQSSNATGCNENVTTTVTYTIDGQVFTETLAGFIDIPIDVECTVGNLQVVSIQESTNDCSEPPQVEYFIVPVTVQVGVTQASQEDVVMSTSNYAIGQQGIWRPHKSFSYVDERTPNDLTSTGTLVDIRNDGICNDFVLFDWINPFFPQMPEASKWKQTNEISKYSRNGEEVENRDIIGLYSTAHYGYADNLPVAVAANAAYHEIGFEGFEEIPVGGYLFHNNKTGGFDIGCNSFEKTTNLTFNILGSYDGGLNVWIDREYYNTIPLPSNVFLLLQDAEGNEYEVAAGINAITPVDPVSAQLNTFFRDDICQLELLDPQSCELPVGIPLTGRAVLQYKNFIPVNKACFVSVTDEAAHSGKNSLKVDVITGFKQKSLQLIQGKRYVVSAWVKISDTTQVFNYPLSEVSLAIDTEIFPAAGAMIEGWQRIEGVFEYTGGELFLALRVFGGTPYYFDDIRIYPEDGSIQTYVYNPEDYRLQAVLDQNNYATFYSYDEEGNLFLIKKETAKGIKTIQETREYVKIAGQ